MRMVMESMNLIKEKQDRTMKGKDVYRWKQTMEVLMSLGCRVIHAKSSKPLPQKCPLMMRQK